MRVGVSMGVSSVSIGTGVQGTVCFRSRVSQDIWNKNKLFRNYNTTVHGSIIIYCGSPVSLSPVEL